MCLLLRVPKYLGLFLIFLLPLGCNNSPTHEAQGYMEGRYTYIATSVSGTLKALFVKRGQTIKKGTLLFELDPQPESDAYEAAMNQVKESVAARDAIVANLAFAKVTFDRYQVLVPKNAIDKASLDNAKSIYNSTLAQVSQANANISAATATLAQSEWRKNQKQVSAPIDGFVFDTYYRLGEFTEANKAILSLLGPTDIKAVFFITEATLGGIHLNDPIRLHCDGCPKEYIGHISFISPTAEYTPPVIFSTETSPKLVFRIEAAFDPKDAVQLHPGQPVRITYGLAHE